MFALILFPFQLGSEEFLGFSHEGACVVFLILSKTYNLLVFCRVFQLSLMGFGSVYRSLTEIFPQVNLINITLAVKS